jgi:hypothetical protein
MTKCITLMVVIITLNKVVECVLRVIAELFVPKVIIIITTTTIYISIVYF